MTRSRLVAAAVCTAFVVLAAAGCGSSGKDADGDAGPPTSADGAAGTTVALDGAVASDGCTAGRGDDLASFQRDGTITVDGADRTFILEIPPEASADQPLPLVVDMHGAGGSASQQDGMTGFGAKGQAEGFVVLSPQSEGTAWNLTQDGVDVEFVTQLLDEVESLVCIDTSRVYLTGFSMGGMMSVLLACGDPSRFAAIAPVAGMIEVEPCDDAPPVPLLAVHGTGDTAVYFDGTLDDNVAFFVPYPSGPSRTELVASWADRNGCSEPPTTEAVGVDVQHETFSCPTDGSVEMYIVDDGSHAWPGSPHGLMVDALPGHLTDTIAATSVIWDFFRAHQRTSD